MAKVTKKKEETKSEVRDSLADDVLSIINKKFKEFPDAAQYLSNANLISSWNSTGCDMLDLAISNRPYGGLGMGTVVEILGPEGSGKSLLAAHIMAECQKKDGIAVLYDTEKAVGMLDFYRSAGLDVTKVIYSDKLRALEEIYESIESIINKIISTDKSKDVVIVVDSVMGATTLTELESDYEKDGYATTKAIVNSKAMRKIPSLIAGRNILIVLINQVRDNLNAVMFGEKHVTSGGKAIGFTASTRLKTAKTGPITVTIDGVKTVVGEQIQVSVVKNRLGPPRRKVTLNILYDSGIDRFGSWLTFLKNLDCVKQSGSSYSYEYVDGETGELITKKFQSKDFKKLMIENPDLRETIYNQICDAYIMKYEIEEEFGIDDIEVDTTNVEE